MKKLLAVIDMQVDFVTGSLGSKESVWIVPNVLKKIEKEKALGTEIVFTKDMHTREYLKTQEGKNLPVEHCIKGETGFLLIEELRDMERMHQVFEKPTFGSMGLAAYVEEQKYDEIELIGLCTDICVISNALLLKAVSPEAFISVDSACCAGVTVESHKNALEALKMCQVNVI